MCRTNAKNHPRRIIPLMSGILFTTLCSLAHADFSMAPDVAVSGDPVAAATSSTRSNHGGGIPLGQALKQLAPEGWHGYSAKGVNTSMNVEIDPRLDWYEALSKMATRYNLHIKADPNDKTIMVSEGPGGMRDLEAEKQRLESAVIASEQMRNQVDVTEGSADFVVRSGQKLSEALSGFLAKGDWKMEWEVGSDFVVKQGYTVTGKSLRDVLDAALTSYGIHAILYTVNRVVVVRSNSMLNSGS